MMKKLILGLCIGLMLGMSTNAFAAIGDKVQAVFAEFNYVVNGESKTVDSPVLVYEGASYVRTTDMGNMLGYDVTYKADSRTIEFNNPDPVQTLTPSMTTLEESPILTPEPTATPEPTPVGQTPSPTPTPDPNATPTPTPDPNATPDPSTEPTTTSSPTPSPTIVPTPSPTPKPDNTAQCQAMRDSWSLKIGMYQGKNPKEQEFTKNIMASQRDAELSAAGC